ncbi:thioredoxin family protein [Limisalsivibrio acetivorans]|uniref:thioredoxin family protein n=1 Tax=Limisalsivibrio acetivorans TaxID=1304888 RepID=UPI0003B3F4E2|nr:thioredoxin family protein [Limisalsivibrio acetivorans]
MKKMLVPVAIFAAAAIVITFSMMPAAGGGMKPEELLAMAGASEKPLVIQLSSDGCVTCRRMQPTFEKLTGEYASDYRFEVIDVDANPKIAGAFQITAVPVQVILSNEGDVLLKHHGYFGYKEFSESLEKIKKG